MGESYSCPSGGVIADGRQRSLKFSDITLTASDGFVPTAAAGQPLMLELHGSGTNPLQVGAFWRATMLSDLAYVANTAHRIPWVGWVIGKNDGYMPWQDQVDFIAAMRTAKRGFAVAWNLGNHSTGPSPTTITDSYYPGLFEIGVGYPLLTNNSADNNPATDDMGGINLGFKWRNVVESAAGWSCEITNILGARTVTVEPISPVFSATVTPQNISIPAANSWVSVSF